MLEPFNWPILVSLCGLVLPTILVNCLTRRPFFYGGGVLAQPATIKNHHYDCSLLNLELYNCSYEKECANDTRKPLLLGYQTYIGHFVK